MRRYASPTTPAWVIKSEQVEVPVDSGYEKPKPKPSKPWCLAAGSALVATVGFGASIDTLWCLPVFVLGASGLVASFLWRHLARNHPSVETWRYPRETVAANEMLADAIGTSIADYGWVLYRAWARADRFNDVNSKTEIRLALARLTKAAGQKTLSQVAVRALVADVAALSEELEKQ